VTDAGPNPSFLALHPGGEYLFAVNEVDEGAVTAMSIDRESGALMMLNRVVTGGEDPCYCAVDATGRYVFVAHYNGGTVAVVPIREDGRLGEPTQVVEHEGSVRVTDRQDGSHPHSVRPSPDKRFVYVADLGSDKFYRYAFGAARGTLELADDPPLAMAPGAGPRHFDFHPTADRIYVLNELNSTLSVLDAGDGALEVVGSTSTLPPDFDGDNLAADVHVDESGSRVYVSNRGHDSIAVFEIDGETDALSRTQVTSTGGECPRSFALSPSGTDLLVGNRQSDEIARFAIDGGDGTLHATGDVTSIPSPSCLQFLPVE
jgi:6-phosphogluconolactonase